jgi:hypothetical protein
MIIASPIANQYQYLTTMFGVQVPAEIGVFEGGVGIGPGVGLL